MSIFPYIYYMIKSFKLSDDEKQVALCAGMVTAAFAFAEFLGGAFWGRLSDKVGRKPILLTGLAGTGISMLAFGFSKSLPLAIVARALGGILNGYFYALLFNAMGQMADCLRTATSECLTPQWPRSLLSKLTSVSCASLPARSSC